MYFFQLSDASLEKEAGLRAECFGISDPCFAGYEEEMIKSIFKSWEVRLFPKVLWYIKICRIRPTYESINNIIQQKKFGLEIVVLSSSLALFSMDLSDFPLCRLSMTADEMLRFTKESSCADKIVRIIKERFLRYLLENIRDFRKILIPRNVITLTIKELEVNMSYCSTKKFKTPKNQRN